MLDRFREIYGSPGDLFEARAPGRVNLIGEHTDYNGGYVMPIAIDRSIRIVFRPSGGSVVDLASVDYDSRETFDLENLSKRRDVAWINYPQGVAHALKESGRRVRGFEGVVQGDVPVGAGLSSSAAFEVAAMLAFCVSSGLEIGRREMALLCQRAEHTYAGVRCGVMDMYVSLFAERDHAVCIDCATNTHELEPLDGSRAAIVVCDTKVEHELAQSEYNTRRAECESALKKLKARLPGIETYKDLAIQALQENLDALDGKERDRARHVVTENQRVLDSIRALKAGDLDAFGELMNASHDSLRDDYEVSCRELDLLVELAREADGVYGSRMTGGGFGGCTVTLVRHEAVEGFRERVGEGYEKDVGVVPDIFVFEPAQGATVNKVSGKEPGA